MRRKIWVLMVSMMLIMTSIPWGTVTAETDQETKANTGQVQLRTAGSDTADSSDASKQDDSEKIKPEPKEQDPEPAEKKEDPTDEQQDNTEPDRSASDQNEVNKKDDQSDQESSRSNDGSGAQKKANANKGFKLDSETDGESGEEPEDTSATDDWLSQLIFYNGSTSDTAEQYEMVPYFEPEQHEYTLYIPDTEAGIYAYCISQIAQSKDYTTSGGTYITYTDTRNHEQEINASMYWEDRNGNYLTRCVSKGDNVNDLTIYTPDGTKEYIVHVRRITSLMSLVAEYGEEETQLFRKGITSYSLRVPKNCQGETLALTPKAYLYTYDDDTIGNENYQIRITDGDKQETVATGSEIGRAHV